MSGIGIHQVQPDSIQMTVRAYLFPCVLGGWMTARFFRNPSSYTRYGQNGWYPRRGPTTRLAALDAERIPNHKGTSRCVNDDPAPGQG